MYFGHVTVSRKLIDLHVDVNKRSFLDGYTALHIAVKKNHIGLVQMLLQAHALPTLMDKVFYILYIGIIHFLYIYDKYTKKCILPAYYTTNPSIRYYLQVSRYFITTSLLKKYGTMGFDRKQKVGIVLNTKIVYRYQWTKFSFTKLLHFLLFKMMHKVNCPTRYIQDLTQIYLYVHFANPPSAIHQLFQMQQPLEHNPTSTSTTSRVSTARKVRIKRSTPKTATNTMNTLWFDLGIAIAQQDYEEISRLLTNVSIFHSRLHSLSTIISKPPYKHISSMTRTITTLKRKDDTSFPLKSSMPVTDAICSPMTTHVISSLQVLMAYAREKLLEESLLCFDNPDRLSLLLAWDYIIKFMSQLEQNLHQLQSNEDNFSRAATLRDSLTPSPNPIVDHDSTISAIHSSVDHIENLNDHVADDKIIEEGKEANVPLPKKRRRKGSK